MMGTSINWQCRHTPVPRTVPLITFYWPSLIGSSGQAVAALHGLISATYCLTLHIHTLIIWQTAGWKVMCSVCAVGSLFWQQQQLAVCYHYLHVVISDHKILEWLILQYSGCTFDSIQWVFYCIIYALTLIWSVTF